MTKTNQQNAFSVIYKSTSEFEVIEVIKQSGIGIILKIRVNPLDQSNPRFDHI